MLDKARLAGILYLALSIAGVFSVLYVPSVVIVRGDAAATAARIADAALLFRIGIAADLFASILFLFLVWTLYQLLESVDRKLALLMVMLVSVSTGMSIFNLVNKIAPLVLSSGAGFLSVFPKPQLDALALAFLRLHDGGLEIISAFWGLWLFPFGILVIKSGFFPKLLGILLFLAGAAYLAGSFVSIVLPAYSSSISKVLMPLEAAELPMLFWLLVKGAPVTRMPA